MADDILSKLNASTESEDIISKLEESINNNPEEDDDFVESPKNEGCDNPETEGEGQNDSIHNGLRLDSDSLSRIMSEKLTRVIVFAGLPEAGKTTLLNAFYQPLVKKGSIDKYEFKSSLTLAGFERRDALCRMSSGNNEPTFERTRSGEMDILHLELCNSTNIVNLAITDLSGEDFKDMLNSSVFCREFTLLKRADSFSLLIDGEKITDLSKRHYVKANSLKLLDIFLEENMLHPNTEIHVIFTKWDIVYKRIQEEKKHGVFINSLSEQIKAKLSKFNVIFQNFTRDNIFRTTYVDAIDIDNFFDSFILPKKNWEYDYNEVLCNVENKSIKRYFSKMK